VVWQADARAWTEARGHGLDTTGPGAPTWRRQSASGVTADGLGGRMTASVPGPRNTYCHGDCAPRTLNGRATTTLDDRAATRPRVRERVRERGQGVSAPWLCHAHRSR